jgi:tetratricopeptide (TPR) repeat protein
MRWFASFVALLLVTLSAAADPEDAVICTGKSFRAPERIAACSVIINAGGAGAEVLTFRGGAYAEVQDFDRAVGDFTAALKLAPAFAQAFSGRGGVHLQRANYDLAIADFSSALKWRTDAVDFFNRGFAFQQRGDYRSAIADYSQALELTPTSAKLLNNRCWARAILGVDLELALGDCDRSLALRQSPVTRDSRAFVYYRLGRFGDAIGEYDAILKQEPGNARALYMRGIAKMRAGEADVKRGREIDGSVTDEFERYRVRP